MKKEMIIPVSNRSAGYSFSAIGDSEAEFGEGDDRAPRKNTSLPKLECSVL